MKGYIKPKLIFTLVTVVLLASAIAVPLAGSVGHSHAQSPTSTPFGPIILQQAPCTNPKPVIPSLHQGDKVSSSVSLTSSDSNEKTQGETLVLAETNGSFTEMIPVANSPQTINFTFTAAMNNDSLTACITNNTSDKDDQTVTISGTITLAPPPTSSTVRLSLQKTALPTPVEPGGTLFYTLMVTNNGPGEAFGVSLTDSLPSQLIAITASPSFTLNGVLTICPPVSGLNINCPLGNLTPGEVATITFNAKVNPNARAQIITNTAVAQSTEPSASATGTVSTITSGMTAAEKQQASTAVTNDTLIAAGTAAGFAIGCGVFAGIVSAPPILGAIDGTAAGIACSLAGVGLGLVQGDTICQDKLKEADPPDPNFKVIAQPVLPTIPQVSTTRGFPDKDTDAVNALDNNMAHTVALEGAFLTSINRAQGAAEAGNAFWNAKQLQAARQYAAQAAELLEAQPRLLDNLQNALQATTGFPTVHIPANLGGGTFPQLLTSRLRINTILQDAETLEQFAGSK